MINTNYTNMYNQIMSAKGNQGKLKGSVKDKTHMSKNMEYLAKAKKNSARTEDNAKSGNASKMTQKTGVTQEDIQKLYAKLNGINYGEYDEKDAYRSMANSFLNEIMGSSKSLFAPQVSRNVLSAAFNAAYDNGTDMERIKQNFNTGDESDS